MKKILALMVLGTAWGLTLSPVLGPSAVWAAGSQTNSQAVVNDGQIVRGDVSQKWVDSQGTRLIAVDGYPYAVPDEFWTQVRVRDIVQRIGGAWTIVAHYISSY